MKTLLRLISYLGRQKLLILALFVMLVVTVGLQSLLPLITKVAIDQGVLSEGGGDLEVLVTMAIPADRPWAPAGTCSPPGVNTWRDGAPSAPSLTSARTSTSICTQSP